MRRFARLLPFIGWGIFAAAFLYHFNLVLKYSVDVPHWDDWDYLPTHPSWSWIFGFHNEHRVPFTKLMVLGLYHLNGWNIALHQVVNFVLYGALSLVLVFALSAWVAGWKSWMSAAFGTVLFSPVAAENHQWATQTSWHACLMFTLISALLLFRENSSRWRLLAGGLTLLGTVYSVAFGVVAAVAVLLIWTLFHFTREKGRKQLWLAAGRWCWVGLPVVLGILAYFHGYQHPPSHQPPATPWKLNFWNYYGVIVGSGFGEPRTLSEAYPLSGLIVLFVWCVTPFFIWGGTAICRGSRQLSPGGWGMIAMFTAIYGGIALIAFGRGNFDLGTAFAGRYAELSLFLVPLGAAAWYWTAQKNQARFWGVMLVLCLGCLATHARLYWRLEAYRTEHELRTRQLELIAQYYAAPPRQPYYLPDFWVPVNTYLESAKCLNVSYYRKMAAAPVDGR